MQHLANKTRNECCRKSLIFGFSAQRGKINSLTRVNYVI